MRLVAAVVVVPHNLAAIVDPGGVGATDGAGDIDGGGGATGGVEEATALVTPTIWNFQELWGIFNWS
jgi:hypothetical protein